MLQIHDVHTRRDVDPAVTVYQQEGVTEADCQQSGVDQIIIITEGFGFLYAAGHILFLQPGSVYLKSPSQRYRLRALKRLSFITVQIDRAGHFLFIRDISSSLEIFWESTMNKMHFATINEILGAQVLMQEINQADEVADEITRQAQKEIALLKFIIFIKESANQLEYTREYQLLDFIFQHCEEKLDWDTLCHSAGLSRRSFCRYTDKNIGVTPEKIHIVFRLIKAQEFLRVSDYSVGNIAKRCGFSTTAQLSNAYRKLFSISPSQEREGVLASHLCLSV